MYKISVIVPFYKGNKYLKRLKQSLEEACSRYNGYVEIILVNDSPNEEIEEALIQSNKYDLVIISQDRNRGIHQARVTGLSHARGKYILFLDQDDRIKSQFFAEMISQIEQDPSVAFVFSNGTFEDKSGRSKLILNSYGKVYGAENYKTYLKVGNLLASPGQCLIRKSSIPKEWKEHIMKTNCADDYLLWILILKKYRAKYVNKILYEHISTGENASGNILNGYKSDLEVCRILKDVNLLSKTELKRFRKRCILNFKKENGDRYSYFEWLLFRQVESAERMRMKAAGIIYFVMGKKLCE